MTDWHGIPEEYQNAIVTGDARELVKRIPDESVDLIFTDPPYKKEFIGLYAWLAQVANRILKPDGFLFAYAGPYHKQQVMEYLGGRLEYYYGFILNHKGNTTILWPRKIISGYKSILCYRKMGSKSLPRTNVLGLVNGVGGDKRFHKWGQSEYTAHYYIECFSEIGDIVFDPMAGAGTFPFVCKKIRRRFIGFDLDEKAAKLARDRVSETLPMIYPQQLELIGEQPADV